MYDNLMNDGDYYSVGAKYTIHICDLIKNGFFTSKGSYHSPLEDYPIFNENYRTALNDIILQHYMMYEIGYETEQQFWFALRSKMHEIMPKYNILLESRDGLEYNPLQDHDYMVDHDETGTIDTTDHAAEHKGSHEVRDEDTTAHSTTDGTYNTITRDSDTPQQNINHLGYGQDDTWINQWLSHGQIINNDHEDESSSQGTDDETTDYTHDITDHRTIDTDTTKNYDQRHYGRRESGQELAYRLSMLAFDIETQIIDELKNLFLNLYEY